MTTHADGLIERLETENTIEVDTAMVYKLRRKPASFGCFWADATIREWKGGGSIDVQSDYGNFAYSWSHIGNCTLREFLCDLDFGYFMGKARPGYMRFDAQKTVRGLRDMILERRRTDPGFSKSDARECWDDVDLFDLENSGSVDCFFNELFRSPDLSKFLDGNYDIVRKSPDANSVAFWQHCWPLFTAHWRDEIAARQSLPTRSGA